MIVLLTLPRGEGIPWPSAQRPPRGLRAAQDHGAGPAGIAIRPGYPADSAPEENSR
jgi:hypothetical protein